jgi:hypothetical protein
MRITRGAAGTQVGAEGTTMSSIPSGDVDMLEGQDQETVTGSGTHQFFLRVAPGHASSSVSCRL